MLGNARGLNLTVDYHFTHGQVIYRGIHADVIVYIFAHLHTALRREENMLDHREQRSSF